MVTPTDTPHTIQSPPTPTPHPQCDKLPAGHQAFSDQSCQQLWQSDSGPHRLTERAFRHLHPGLAYTVGQFVQANTMMLVKGQVFPGARKSSGLLDTLPKCLHVGSWVCLGVFLHECGRVSARLCVHAGAASVLKAPEHDAEHLNGRKR